MDEMTTAIIEARLPEEYRGKGFEVLFTEATKMGILNNTDFAYKMLEIEESTNLQPFKVIFCLEGIKSVDRLGRELLLTANAIARRSGGQIALANVSQELLPTFGNWFDKIELLPEKIGSRVKEK